MSWIHKLGTYSNYTAKNYAGRIAKDICNKTLNAEIQRTLRYPRKIPSIVNGKEFYGSCDLEHHSPSYGKHKIYSYSYLDTANYNELNDFDSAKKMWKNLDVDKKFELFEKIADLVENKYYYQMMAATMVGQGKNFKEAELDAIAETVDFLRFNIQYASQIYQKQPIGDNNYSQYLPLLGRVAAITPFNFTAIAANLSTAPLYFGNSVFWKPSEKSLLSNYLFYEICLEAGIPAETLNFVLMKPDNYINEVIRNKCGGILFTGSTNAFINILGNVNYKQHFPRIMGETGGKNFHFIEKSADIELAIEKTYQSAYGYSGQKCSACSIVYVPDTHYTSFIEGMREYHKKNHPEEQKRYCLIGKDSYQRTTNLLSKLNDDEDVDILMGGSYSDEYGYYVEPTMVKVKIDNDIMKKELFAPILVLKMYQSNFTNLGLHECSINSEYKLTGAVFSNDENFIKHASETFENSCGNFYINDKSTGSVVGQQPFGGFGKSGTNDKAGDINFMMRLYNQRNIKSGYNEKNIKYMC